MTPDYSDFATYSQLEEDVREFARKVKEAYPELSWPEICLLWLRLGMKADMGYK